MGREQARETLLLKASSHSHPQVRLNHTRQKRQDCRKVWNASFFFFFFFSSFLLSGLCSFSRGFGFTRAFIGCQDRAKCLSLVRKGLAQEVAA